MNSRIKKVRKTLDLTQKEFGERIGVKGNTIAQYELGRNKPVDSVLALICREFNVNEKWLRTGEGEMFKADATNELEALAQKYKLSHGEYIFLEKYFKAKQSVRMEFFEILDETFKAIQESGVPATAPAMPNGTDPALESDISILEEEYKKSRSDSASKTTLSASNIIDEQEKNA